MSLVNYLQNLKYPKIPVPNLKFKIGITKEENPQDFIINNKVDFMNLYHKNQKGFKIIMLGDVAVGKTSLFNCLLNQNKLPYDSLLDNLPNTTSTYSPDVKMVYHNDAILIYNDTAGQEIFKSICQNYYRDPQIVIFVFDVTKMESFMHIPEWQQTVIEKNQDSNNIKYYLIANKRDLCPTKDLTGAKTFAENNNMTFIVTSAKQPETIDILRNNIHEYIDKNKEKGETHIVGDLFKLVTTKPNCCT